MSTDDRDRHQPTFEHSEDDDVKHRGPGKHPQRFKRAI
jgi:hypothetical protein